MQDKRKATIVGGGPVGSLMTINLAKFGFEVDVYERRPDPREAGHIEGRSINLALSERGLTALEKIGLKGTMLDIATPMKGRLMHAVDGTTTFQRYGKDDNEVINAVSRGELSNSLTKIATRMPGVEYHFLQQCKEVDVRNRNIVFRNRSTDELTTVDAEVVFGCDGANSAVRHSLARLPRFSTSQQYIDYGYKELTIPAGSGGEFRMEPNALHIWPRGKYMLIALPNYDGSFTCTLFFPYEGTDSFASIQSPDEVEELFTRQFPDAKDLIPDLTTAFFENPTGALPSIRCSPWHWEDFAVLVGDAAHGMVPFLGQGLNCAFESSLMLLDCLEENNFTWENSFKDYFDRRKKDADAIIDMALENFIEMRDKVGDERFLLKKELELELERRYQTQFMTRYGMIQFHGTPYADALRRGETNDRITDQLLDGISCMENVDWDLAYALVKEHSQ